MEDLEDTIVDDLESQTSNQARDNVLQMVRKPHNADFENPSFGPVEHPKNIPTSRSEILAQANDKISEEEKEATNDPSQFFGVA